MKVARKMMALAVSLVLFVLTAPTLAFAADGERCIVYAQVPEDWTAPCIWAWADDGTNAFEAWPGEKMKADGNNPGWYYCWIPAGAGNVIINANEGGVQTADQKLEAKNAWLTIADADTVEVSYEEKTTGEIPPYVETFAVHAKVEESWRDVRIWAWLAPDGTNAFEAWPGEAMEAGETGWYTANVPVWVNSVIINANGGEVQTEDLTIDAAEVWVTVDAEGAAEFTYDDPEAPAAEDITVHVQAPADWSAPHLWAWSAPDGTNAFSAWPGEALQEAEGGWLALTVPGWINSIIVNGNEGSVQTSDLSADVGKDVWIVVTDAENAEVLYEEPAAAPAAPDAPATPVPAAKEQPAESGVNPVVIVIAAVVVIAAAAGVMIARKKKRS